MAFTPAQIERRKKVVGASEVAAIMGLSPYANAHDTFLLKTGRVEHDESGNAATEAGTRFESGVMAWAKDKLGAITRPSKKDDLFRRADSCNLGATLDGILDATGEPVEGKTAGLFGPLSEEWGDEGTDQVPDSYILQIHAQLIALNDPDIKGGHLPAFLGGKGFVMFQVPWNQAIAESIIAAVDAFWKHVRSDTPPPITPSLDVVRRVKRIPQSVCEIDPGLIEHWREMESSFKAVEASLKESKAAVLSAMDDAEACAMTEAGAATFLEQSDNRFREKLFRADHPELHEKYKRNKPHRVLRYKKVPGAKKLAKPKAEVDKLLKQVDRKLNSEMYNGDKC